ncbi:MAG: TRAP transporter TatT component family protein [Candidatus Brocadiales bacterium]
MTLHGLKAETPKSTLAELDALYDGRSDTDMVRQITTNCDRLLADDPGDYELLWRCSRAYFHLGREASTKKERLEFYNKAVDAGKSAVKANNDRPEGHFWLGISIAAVGETSGILKSLGSVGDIKEQMERVIAIDATYEEGGAYRIMGRIDHKVPWIFGGRKARSHEYYQKALAVAPDNTYTRLFLAELLLDEDKNDDARKELRFIIDTGNRPEWAYDIKVNKEKAHKLLEEIDQEELSEKYLE